MKKARMTARVTDGDGVQRSRRYWTVAEFCKVVDRSPFTAQRWRSEGGGPPYLKVGGRVLYDEEVVHEWCASHEQNSTSDYEIVEKNEDEEPPAHEAVDPKPSKAGTHKWDRKEGRFVQDDGER